MFLTGISNMLIPFADIFFQASTGLCSLVLWPYSYEILRESANLCVEILNSRRQTKGDLVTWYKFAFSV